MKIYQKRSLIFLYIMGSLGVVLLGVLLLYMHHPVVAWANIIFFGIIGLPILIYKFIKPGLMFEMLNDGFYCETWGYVEWKNIEDIILWDIADTKIIMFNTKNIIDKHKGRQNSNELLTKHSYDISLSGTGMNIEQIYNLMLEHTKNK